MSNGGASYYYLGIRFSDIMANFAIRNVRGTLTVAVQYISPLYQY